VKKEMQRESNFVEFPGTGIWAVVTKDKSVKFYESNGMDSLKWLAFSAMQGNSVYWCDRGMGIMNFALLINGVKESSSASLITREAFTKRGVVL
jgi:hypothetical protein